MIVYENKEIRGSEIKIMYRRFESGLNTAQRSGENSTNFGKNESHNYSQL
jgi:hypothetical protein